MDIFELANISDAAKRLHDTFALHKIGEGIGSYGRWFAVRLTDGTSDNTLYGSKSEAVNHQHHDENFYAFVQVGPWSMSLKEAETVLDVQRRMYDAGLRLADRDHAQGGRDVIRRLNKEDQRSQISSMLTQKHAPSNLIILPGSN